MRKNSATELGDTLKLSDAPTVTIMSSNNVTEIYTFDEDFDRIEGITRLPKSA